MGVMPERIGKGPVLRKLDQRYASKNKRDLAFTRLTTDGRDVADIGAEDDGTGEIVLDAGEKDHLKNHWFGQGGNGWWDAAHVDHILKHGLITALEEARKLSTGSKNVPIKTLWICSGDSTTGPFEVYVYPTNEQVTLIIFSPSLPNTLYQHPSLTNKDDIWVVKRIRHVPETEGKLDGHKDGDVVLVDLGDKIEIVKRQPKTT